MYKYSEQSLARLSTCHEDLRKIFYEVIKVMDVTIIEGHRTQDQQKKVFEEGKSRAQWPMSKHNKYPSMAIDVAPYPIDWDDRERFFRLAGLVQGIAQQMGVEVNWGGDWSFFDGPHFELPNGTKVK